MESRDRLAMEKLAGFGEQPAGPSDIALQRIVHTTAWKSRSRDLVGFRDSRQDIA